MAVLALGLWVAKSSFILLLAAATCRALQSYGAHSRHLIWTISFCSILALPVVSYFLPNRSTATIPLLSFAPGSVVRDLPSRTVPQQTQGFQEELPLEAVSRPISVLPPAAMEKLPSSSHVFAAATLDVWILGALLCVMRQVVSRLHLASRSKSQGFAAASDYTHLSGLVGVHRKWRLIFGDHPFGPMTWGTFRPTVALPQTSAAWPSDQLETVLLHELVHVKRLDSLTLSIGTLVCALLWFHPCVWTCLRAQRAEAEAATDESVLDLGVKPTDYADTLLQVAHETRSGFRFASSGVHFMKKPSLDTRIRAILNPSHRVPRTRSGALIATSAFLIAIAPCVALQLTTAEAAQTPASQSSTSSQIQEKRAIEAAQIRTNALASKLESLERHMQAEKLAIRHGASARRRKAIKRDQERIDHQVHDLARLHKYLAEQLGNVSQAKLLLQKKRTQMEAQRSFANGPVALNPSHEGRTFVEKAQLQKLNDELKQHPEISWKNLQTESEESMFAIGKGEPTQRTAEQIEEVKRAEQNLSGAYRNYKAGAVNKELLEKAQAELEAARGKVQFVRPKVSSTIIVNMKALFAARKNLLEQEKLLKSGAGDQDALKKAQAEYDALAMNSQQRIKFYTNSRQQKSLLYQDLMKRDTLKKFTDDLAMHQDLQQKLQLLKRDGPSAAEVDQLKKQVASQALEINELRYQLKALEHPTPLKVGGKPNP